MSADYIDVPMPELVVQEPDGLEGTLARLNRFLTEGLQEAVGFIPIPSECSLHPAQKARFSAYLRGSWTGRGLRSELTQDEAAWLILGPPMTLDPTLPEGTIRIQLKKPS